MSKFNKWFLSLSEGEQKILADDRWMLAEKAFNAGRENARDEARVDIRKLTKALSNRGERKC